MPTPGQTGRSRSPLWYSAVGPPASVNDHAEPAPPAVAAEGCVATTPPDAPALSWAAFSASGGGSVAGRGGGAGTSGREGGSPSTDTTETGSGAGSGATIAPT